MKKGKIRNRIISLLLTMVMVLQIITSVGLSNPVTAQAATTSQNNIVARADYLYNITWVAQSTVYGWKYNYTFYQGGTYRIPYGQPINSGAYVGYGVSVEDFLSAANTAGSVFYTSRSTYGSTSSVYYATDCSAFVSWCWGVGRKTTYSIPQVSTYIGMATASNATLLQLGDCLNSNDVGHVVLVTDLVYDSSGNLTSIEITEQTPPQLKRTTYTPAALGAKYGTYYGIYRYSGTVPAAPDGSTNDDSGSTGTTTSGSGIFATGITTKYFPACDSSCATLYDAMASIGVTLTTDMQDAIAALNGIEDYNRTAEQNMQILSMLKAGTLKNPGYAEYYEACDSSYTTFYAAMESIGVSVDWTLHCEIAEMNGITDFEGTVAQNTILLNLLKEGKLIKPFSQIDYGETEDSGGTESGGTESGGTDSGSTDSGSGDSGDTGSDDTVVISGTNGYERGYEGGMAGTGSYEAFGLDVSEWQKSYIDFDAIKEAGYDFVILRAGTTNKKDDCFEDFYTQARAAGLDIGAYFFSYATDVTAAEADAELMLSYIEGKTFEYPVYFDYETSEQLALDPSVSGEICLAFMDAMAAEGYLVGLYTSQYYSTVLPVDTICDKYEIWVAQYLGSGDGYDGTNDYEKYGQTYASVYGMYQYTCAAYIDGVGPYDADLVYKDYPTIVKTYGFNGYSVSGVTEVKEKLQATVDQVAEIRHYNYTEDTILEIRAAYSTALELLESDVASEVEIEDANEKLTALLAQTGTNTIGENNDGVYVNERNSYVNAGDCVLFTSDFNDGTGLVTIDNANIQYTYNVVFEWNEERNVYVVKSASEGIGASTPDIQLESGEFLIACHQWETGVTDGTAVEYSATNYSILQSLSVGDAVRLSGVSATGTDTTVEPAAYLKFMPQDYVYITGKNSYVLSGDSVIFTADYNSGLLDASSANLIYTYNVLAQWDDETSTWKVIDSFYGYPEGTTSVQLEEGQLLIAAHDWETGVSGDTAVSGSAANGAVMNAAQIGQQIVFSGVTADSASYDISVAANISFIDEDTNTEDDTVTGDDTKEEYTVTFVNYDGTVLSQQTVVQGEAAVAPEEPTKDNYKFTGWDKDFSSVTEDMTITAKFERYYGTLKISVNGGNGFSISTDNGAARPQGNSYINTKTVIGSYITVTAYEVEGVEFIGWLNAANNKIETTEMSLSFYANGNNHYEAMYATVITDVNLVIFKNDKANQILDMQYYALGDEIVFPSDPSYTGYDFTGWSHTEEEIQAALAEGTDVTVTPTWEVRKVYVDVNVTGGSVTSYTEINDAGQYLSLFEMTVTADEAAEGQKFAYWKDKEGTIKSFNSSYTFYPAEDTSLTAVFVGEAEEIPYEVLVSVDVIDTTTNDTKNVIYFSWFVPEEEMDITYVTAGLIFTNKLYYDEETFISGAGGNVLEKTFTEGDVNNIPANAYSITKTNVSVGDTWVAMAYVKYIDNTTNETITVYSELVEATKY